MNPNLASDEAITDVGRVVILCLETGNALGWPQINPEHGRELLREIRFWRAKAGLLPFDKSNQ